MDQTKADRIVRFAAAIVLAAFSAYFIWLIATRSAEPRAYFEHRRGVVGHWEYPIVSVLGSCGLLVGEAAVLWMALALPKTALWKKSLFAFGIALPGASMGIATLMHSPPYFGIHVFWLVSITLCLLALFLLSGIAGLSRAILSKSRRAAG